jgi:NTP pyrophosphatase (non-canonical NTP hydrolase)
MTPAEYKQFCESTYVCPPSTDREEYLRLLLIEEIGEVASLFAKAMRDGVECPLCNGRGFTRHPTQMVYNKKINTVEHMRIGCKPCEGGALKAYGPEAVNRDALLRELGDVMWCAAMLEFDSFRFCSEWVVEGGHWTTCATSKTLLAITFDGIDAPFYWASELCIRLGFTPESVAQANVEKLKDRVQRGTIHGAGDER